MAAPPQIRIDKLTRANDKLRSDVCQQREQLRAAEIENAKLMTTQLRTDRIRDNLEDRIVELEKIIAAGVLPGVLAENRRLRTEVAQLKAKLKSKEWIR